MASFSWSLSKLEQLLNHSQSSVQEWAVEKLAHLYPAEFETRLPRLLQDQRPAVVKRSLQHIGSKPREDCLPFLEKLYLTGPEAVSAAAIQKAGDWRSKESLEWMKRRILLDPPLQKDQIIAMIYALGRTPDEEAYDLLKQTEKAVQEKDSSYWDLFYASLLEHRRVADVEYLLKAAMDEDLQEDRRRDSLGLLLAQVDPMLNPSDVFFANHPAVQRRLLQRLDSLPNPGDANSEMFKDLRQLIADLQSDITTAIGTLEKLAERSNFHETYETSILKAALKALQEHRGETPWHYGLRCLGASAILQDLEKKSFPPPPSDADWRVKLHYLLRNSATQADDEALQQEVVNTTNPKELISALCECVKDHPQSWGALRSIEMLGDLMASEALEAIVHAIKQSPDDLFTKVAHRALVKIGLPAVPYLMEQLEKFSGADRFMFFEVLAKLPTERSVEVISSKFPSLYAENQEGSLRLAFDSGAKDFLPFLEREYRPGEWHLGRVIVHLCRVNEMELERYKAIERDVQRGDAFIERSRRSWDDEKPDWPEAILLELSCRNCAKKYHYELKEIHQHPHNREQKESDEKDFTPYKHGLVIVDDVRCKNCQALNDFELTATSFAQITTESLKLLAFQRLNRKPPAYYPFKLVQLDEKDGKPLTLLDIEKEHQTASEQHPSKPAVHLAAGKFYEYVKDYPAARKAYLQAVDLDTRALEALAGLARLDHAEGRLHEALKWIESCYENLEKGSLYLTEDATVFKKTVRQKRREFARDLGTKPGDKPIEIRFKFETSDYPKNKPCPCGSGKKYKLCCMK